MKVLLINAGPHPKGCTYTALREVEGALNEAGVETELFFVGNGPIRGCTGCGACRSTGRCMYEDAVNVALEKAKAADGFIFGSPVHYASATGMATSFFDRLFYAGGRKVFGYKPGACVVSARRAGTTAALDQLQKYLTISCMPVVSSQYWNMVHGNTPEDVLQDAEGLQIMRTLGRNMAWLLRSIEAGRAAGVELPTAEEPVRTNFIR